jgi:DNA-binding NarL/FixJ family response regulator
LEWIKPGERMDPIKVFLVDDHRIFLEGLVKLIQDQASMKIIGTASDGREAIKQVQALQPDVILMDISMPNLNGVEATRRISQISPKIKVVILTMHENEEFLRRSLEAGAMGYLLKDSSADELFMAIREVHRGNAYLSPPLSRKLISDYLGFKKGEQGAHVDLTLSGREREILQLLAEGQSNKAISKCLNLSLKTVETHRKNIMKKLNLHRITDLVRYAIQKGIIVS